MKSKYFKITSIFLAGIIVFSACEDKDDSPNLGDAVGLWQLNSLTGTYDRKVITKTGVEHSADAYPLVANWKDAAGFAAASGADEAVVTGATNQTLASFKAGDNAPGFPRTAVFDAAGLAAVGISMQVELLDSKDKDSPGTYNVKGTYPSLRLDAEKCNTYLMIPPPQINDTGDWTVNYDTKIFTLSPVVDIEQVLPPFDDGTFRVNREVEPATFELDFVDRDGHDTRYQEVQPTWSEADDRVVSGLGALPVNAAGGWDPTADTDPVAEAYIMSAALASWGNYLTWYAFNVIAEAAVKVADVKNPLTDLNADGDINAVDMVIYMHMDNLASGGGKTSFGMPYALLVDSTNPAAPAVVDDSASDFALSGLATGAGGKMKYVINKGVCMPVNETITFDSGWLEVVQ
jgi:hypothetical protein